MNDSRLRKHLLDGSVGVKFQAVQLSEKSPPEAADVYVVFRHTCECLKTHHMTPVNGGNVSIRCGDGFFIFATG
ncbi:MAG: hypothetical protein JRG73_03765 [Deltaproteobacteria bacterium]|nr:hypothetical protein [Deltaproteobacteria bacterium]MBW2306030.1 hypothetical protein [Deltaproteobacteria bacterium]